jgi:hypothetical protein
LVATFTSDEGWSRRSILYFERPVRLALEPGGLLVGAKASGDAVEVAIHAKTLAMACELSAPVAGRFSDNGFDLLPDETRVLRFVPDRPAAIKGAWSVKTVNQMAAEARRAGR